MQERDACGCPQRLRLTVGLAAKEGQSARHPYALLDPIPTAFLPGCCYFLGPLLSLCRLELGNLPKGQTELTQLTLLRLITNTASHGTSFVAQKGAVKQNNKSRPYTQTDVRQSAVTTTQNPQIEGTVLTHPDVFPLQKGTATSR